MSKQVKIQKTVFNKAAFNETVNTEFTQLVTTPDPSFFDINLATQNDFWILYEKFFYEIPKEGEINSHEYLAKTSGEYINLEDTNEEIQALQAEIAQLRSDLLSAQMDNIRIAAEPSDSEQTNVALEVFERELRNANENIIETNTTLSQNVQTSTNTPSVTSGGGTSGGGAVSSLASSGGSTGGGTSPGGGGGGGY